MAALAFCPVSLRALDECQADVLALTLFSDERPLRGLIGLVDWRLRGALSRWVRSGFVSGQWGERVLVPSHGRLTFPRLLLMGLGDKASYRADRARAAAQAAVQVTTGLSSRTLAVGLFGLPQLNSPFKRTGVELCNELQESELLDAVTVVATDEHVQLIREYGEFA